MNYGKRITTEIKGEKLIETTENIAEGSTMNARKVRTEERIEVRGFDDVMSEFEKFAREEEELRENKNLLSAEFEIQRTPATEKRGTRYVIKKFTILDGSFY